MNTTITPINPGILIKSRLVLHSYKVKDLARKSGMSQPTVSAALKRGSISIPIAKALEELGINTALEWVTLSAQYKLGIHDLNTVSAQA